MTSVKIKRSPQGSVVVVRGWGFVTASALMTYKEAVHMAGELMLESAKKENENE